MGSDAANYLGSKSHLNIEIRLCLNFFIVLEISPVCRAFFCMKGSKNLCVSLQMAGICPLGRIVVMTLRISKLEAEIMVNVTQESWNGTVDVVKISEIGYFL